MMNRNWKKLFASLFSAVLLIGLGSSLVQAEENPLNAKTDIEVTVEEGEIIEPPTEGDGGEENPGGQNGQLSIWVKPLEMKFKGKYDEVKDYNLDLVINEKDNGHTLDYRRLGVADIRSDEIGWDLNAHLTDLTTDDGRDAVDAANYRMLMNLKAEKYIIEDGEVTGIDESDDNGVKINNNVEISQTPVSLAKVSKDAENRAGKAYTSIKMEDIKLNFDANTGTKGNYKGQVIWDLSSAAE